MSVASTRRADVLVERDRLLEQIEEVVARAAEGEARMLLIEGQAGIGKSRLAAEARRRAADAGMTVVTARAARFAPVVAGLSERAAGCETVAEMAP